MILFRSMCVTAGKNSIKLTTVPGSTAFKTKYLHHAKRQSNRKLQETKYYNVKKIPYKSLEKRSNVQCIRKNSLIMHMS